MFKGLRATIKFGLHFEFDLSKVPAQAPVQLVEQPAVLQAPAAPRQFVYVIHNGVLMLQSDYLELDRA